MFLLLLSGVLRLDGEELAAPVAPASVEAVSVKGVVNADKLNVRVKPGLGRSVVAMLPQGSSVDARRLCGEWVEIAAPKSAAVWVAASYVSGGSLKKGALLRAGPGVAYEVFGAASSVERVDVVDSSQEGWLRIAPPSWLCAYASTRHLAFDEAGMNLLKSASEGKERQPLEKASLLPDISAETEAKAGEFGRNVVMEGILLPVRDTRHVATHALAVQVSGEYHTLCYLTGSNFNLQLWERRKVRVKGVQSWVGDWRRPLVEIELITPVWQ